MVMFKVDEADMDRIIYYQRKTKVEIARHPESGVWRIDSPSSVKADVSEVAFVVRLSFLHQRVKKRLEKLPDSRTGLKRPRMVFEVQRKDGSHEALYVGRHFRNDGGAVFFWVKAQGSETVYVMSENTLTRLRAGFGQR